MSTNRQEIERGERFQFGSNWRHFLRHLTQERIDDARTSIQVRLECDSLQGRRFLDAGCGSGLFSLVASELGAKVHSFDFDPLSVACAETLRHRFGANSEWTIEEGSVLDLSYVTGLGTFDVVYSWGVLHHTGSMYEAINNVCHAVAADGQFCLAIYNDQQIISRYWMLVKRIYNRNFLGRIAMIVCHAPYLIGLRYLVRAAKGRGKLGRGMSLWHDTLDWLGGYPFQVAKPEQVIAFLRERGFTLQSMVTCGGRMGCNEFVFKKTEYSS
jgi:2-polyprenyl-6-hydroxyphenyl methylase/3-demethylubiquinone-9 3-methyltransferase